MLTLAYDRFGPLTAINIGRLLVGHTHFDIIDQVSYDQCCVIDWYYYHPYIIVIHIDRDIRSVRKTWLSKCMGAAERNFIL